MNDRLDAVEAIIAESAPTSVRFVYYRAVSQGLVPKSNSTGYPQVQRATMKLRDTGRVPWTAIVDSSRWMRKPRTWLSADDALHDLTESYRRAMWQDVGTVVEVWCESESVAGVLWPVCHELDVPLFPIKGQSSASFAYGAAQSYKAEPKSVRLIYVGDHDPAGLEIESHLVQKLGRFSGRDDLQLDRLGVTPTHVDDLGLIGTPAKKAHWIDAAGARHRFAGQAVEVEAIDAPLLRMMLREAVEAHLDPHVLHAHRVFEESERQGLAAMAAGWSA